MSALSHLASPATIKYASVLEQNLVQPFALPDGTPYEISVTVHASTQFPSSAFDGGNYEAPIAHVILKTEQKNHWIDTQGKLLVRQPLLPFSNPAAEPSDHSFASRSKRYAVVHIQTSDLDSSKLWIWIGSFFTLWPSQEFFTLSTSSFPPVLIEHLLYSGLAILHPAIFPSDSTHVLVSRAAFWQGIGVSRSLAPWVLPTADSSAIISLLSSNQTLPAPPTKPEGIIYSRYIPGLNSHLTFRVASSLNEKHVDLLTRWHSSDRVNEGWRQRLSREEQIKTIQATENDPFSIGLIGEWDGEPWGYVEIYYAKESNLASHYTAETYDRGFHALVGEDKFRGPHRVRSWMGSVVHLMFLLNSSTTRGISEPRLSNTKMVEYECMCGGHVEKFIDFPHKRAALVWFPRERFFQLCPLQPLPEHIKQRE